jgi:hypothetical protein
MCDTKGETDVPKPLRRLRTFLVGPTDVALEPIGAVFEGGIELVAGGVLDDLQPGVPLRMAFDWRIQEPVSDSLVMFVHFGDDVEPGARRSGSLAVFRHLSAQGREQHDPS